VSSISSRTIITTICILSRPQSATHDCYNVSHSVYVTGSIAEIASTKIALVADRLATSNSFLKDQLDAFSRRHRVLVMATNITFHPGSANIEERVDLLQQRGITIWLTGLSASGKSTIACALEQHLLHLHKFTYRLDGDNVRFGLNKDLGFDERSRNENIRRIGEVSRLFTDAACITLTAFISPYRADRALARKIHEEAGLNFIEVFVDAPLEVVEQRDPKGLYKKARAGEIQEFTGISAPYEPPLNAELHIKTADCEVKEAVQMIADYLLEKGYITAVHV